MAALPGEQGFLVAWDDWRSGHDLYGQRVTEAGTLLGGDQLLVDKADWLESLAVAAHAGLPKALLAWEWYGEIYAQRYGVLVVDFEAAPLTGQAFTAKSRASAASIHRTAARP